VVYFIMVSKYVIYKSACLATEISAPYVIVTAIGAAVTIDLFEKFYNKGYDVEIEKYENELFKSTQLYLKIKELIENLAWVENNVILTAVSDDANCNGYKAQFDYNENITYKDKRGTDNYNEIIKKMIELTCLYKSKICDETDCYNNLLNYTKCKEDKRKGITKECPFFNNKCELK